MCCVTHTDDVTHANTNADERTQANACMHLNNAEFYMPCIPYGGCFYSSFFVAKGFINLFPIFSWIETFGAM